MPNRPEIHLRCELVDHDVSAEGLCGLLGRTADCAVLESSNATTTFGQYSIYAVAPIDSVTLTRPVQVYAEAATAWDELKPLARRLRVHVEGMLAEPRQLPFVGGWIGFVAYEAAHPFGREVSGRRQKIGSPLAHFRLYDTFVIHDRCADRWYVAGADLPPEHRGSREPARNRMQRLSQLLREYQRPPGPQAERSPESTPARANMTRRQYEANVARVKAYIKAGDTYQVNLTQRFTCNTDLSPEALYLRLRAFTPSSHAAMLRIGRQSVISASPELLFELRDGSLLTRPIKGTRRRTGDARADSLARHELTHSEKECAELNMIVDLMRNDLGRVSEPGSVRVVDGGSLEEHPTLYHRVATIAGQLQRDRSVLDVLAAGFPGGSVTGAPKLRAMQIIDELEPSPRGVYCGAIGYVGFDGNAAMNIAIRTMVQTDQTVHAFAGGAITADSEADQEFDEIRAKAAAMFRALHCAEAVADAPRAATKPRFAHADMPASVTS